MVKCHARGDHPKDPVRAAALDKVLRFELSPEACATVEEALAKLQRQAGGHVDQAEALLLMARQVLGGPADEGRSSYQIAVSLCPSCGSGFQQARGELVALGPAALEMAECDAQYIGDVDAPAQGNTHVGAGVASKTSKPRAAQNIPPSIRRTVVRRAGHCCQVPGCRHAGFLDIHHRTLRSEGGQHDPNELLLACGAHHAALHDGRLLLDGDAATGWSFRHADGSPYGAGLGVSPAPQQVDAAVKVFRGLCSLGFKQGEARRALDEVTRRQRVHVGTDATSALTTEQMLREALRLLSARRR
jgi:hypothetical protein